jgi:hypothetical protein
MVTVGFGRREEPERVFMGYAKLNYLGIGKLDLCTLIDRPT